MSKPVENPGSSPSKSEGDQEVKLSSYEQIEKKLNSWKTRYFALQDTYNKWVRASTSPGLTEVSLVSSKLGALDETLNQYLEDFHLNVTDSAEIATLKANFESYSTNMFNMQVKVNTIKANIESGLAARKTSTPFKLEKLQLPKFNGKFSEWNNFCDLFSSAVVNNTGLNEQEKMVYLKSCLCGDATSIVSSFSSTSTSFQQAWDLVKNRFKNVREIAFAHLRKFDELKQCQESSTGLRKLIDVLNECTNSLKSMSIPVEHWDVILVFLALKKLDMDSRKEWLLTQTSNDLPKLAPFLSFLENRATALADSSLTSKKSKNESSTTPSKEGNERVIINAQTENKVSCQLCKDEHHLYQCKQFSSLPADERKKVTKEKRLCYNCLFGGHGSPKCTSKHSCKTCGERHHTLLHMAFKGTGPTASTSSSSVPGKSVQSSSESTGSTLSIVSEPTPSSSNLQSIPCHVSSAASYVPILQTALVYAIDVNGEKVMCRVFLDGGAGTNLVSEEFAMKLGLKTKDTYVIVPKIISSYLPPVQCTSDYEHLKDIQLADPSWYLSGKIDILIGARCIGKLRKSGHIIGPIGMPDAENTVFGWIVSGESKPAYSYKPMNQQVNLCTSTNLDASLQRFWEIEESESSSHVQNQEDVQCEKLFTSSVSREDTGRYIVSLPFKLNAQGLGNSRDRALGRFTRLESKLIKEKDVYESYKVQMQEHLVKGIMEEIPKGEINVPCSSSYYMPHHVVSKMESTSTKHRIVFDASAKTSNGISLNDVLMQGPKLQVDLVPLLLRFRTYVVAMSADIVKFYNQVSVDKYSSDFQRLLWRASPTEEIKDFRMKRVTFGVSSAPYLAIRTLHQLATDYEDQYPKVYQMLKEEFLVDNLLSGGQTVQEALDKQAQIIEVVGLGMFKLRKWASNESEIVQAVAEEDRELKFPCKVATDEVISTIGLLWNPNSDTFNVKIPHLQVQPVSTKREVLSAIARVFDPMGWLSPVTVNAKILLQKLWKSKVGWEDPIPSKLQMEWNQYCHQFQGLKDFQLNRCLIPRSDAIYQVHAVSDASDDAYSTCIYLRAQVPDGLITSELIIAKTKVAPVKTLTTPRLELCGAALSAKVVKTFLTSVQIPISSVHCYTDSTSVLGQLTTDRKLEVFVNNRVSMINTTLPNAIWHHVPGEDNPADCASRGIPVKSFLNHKLWKHGPEFLLNEKVQMLTTLESNSTFFQTQITKFIQSCSSFSKMKRTIAIWIRFTRNLKPGAVKNFGQPNSSEQKQALTVLVKSIQAETLQSEINSCKRKLVHLTKLKNLSPFLDQNGVLRVGGRLRNSFFTYDMKHPILLPKNQHFTKVLVRHFHQSNQHAGPQLLLALVRAQFWIPRGAQLCSEIVRRCIQCHRSNPQSLTQLMGQLPEERVSPSDPFSNVGVDYCGPFYIAEFRGRKPKILKSYVSVFVCLCTKAIHLEVAGDMSTESFVGALKRFISRRGLAKKIICDGGRNFLGAKNEALEFQKFLESHNHQSQIQKFFGDQGIEYQFNPPYAPHHGGIFEAAVKSFKVHLHKVVGDRHLSLEEFITLLSEVEASLNSRPISPMSQEPNDFNYLSFGHFLIGRPLKSLPQENVTNLKPHSLSRWQHVQQLSQHFFQRWSTQYIQSLQKSNKWFKEQPNFGVGTLVLLNESDTPVGPQSWKLGRISATFPGKDQLVRVCEVIVPTTTFEKNGKMKTKLVTYKRPITKISPLPMEVVE